MLKLFTVVFEWPCFCHHGTHVPTTLEGKVPLSTGGVMTDPFSPFVMSAAADDATRCDEKTHSLSRRGRCEADAETFTCIVR